MSAIELVREVRRDLATMYGSVAPDMPMMKVELDRLDAALAEMERDQPFIEAAAAYEELLSRDMRNAANKEAIQERIASLHSNMLAAGRARREGMEHDE